MRIFLLIHFLLFSSQAFSMDFDGGGDTVQCLGFEGVDYSEVKSAIQDFSMDYEQCSIDIINNDYDCECSTNKAFNNYLVEEHQKRKFDEAFKKELRKEIAKEIRGEIYSLANEAMNVDLLIQKNIANDNLFAKTYECRLSAIEEELSVNGKLKENSKLILGSETTSIKETEFYQNIKKLEAREPIPSSNTHTCISYNAFKQMKMKSTDLGGWVDDFVEKKKMAYITYNCPEVSEWDYYDALDENGNFMGHCEIKDKKLPVSMLYSDERDSLKLRSDLNNKVQFALSYDPISEISDMEMYDEDGAEEGMAFASKMHKDHYQERVNSPILDNPLQQALMQIDIDTRDENGLDVSALNSVEDFTKNEKFLGAYAKSVNSRCKGLKEKLRGFLEKGDIDLSSEEFSEYAPLATALANKNKIDYENFSSFLVSNYNKNYCNYSGEAKESVNPKDDEVKFSRKRNVSLFEQLHNNQLASKDGSKPVLTEYEKFNKTMCPQLDCGKGVCSSIDEVYNSLAKSWDTKFGGAISAYKDEVKAFNEKSENDLKIAKEQAEDIKKLLASGEATSGVYCKDEKSKDGKTHQLKYGILTVYDNDYLCQYANRTEKDSLLGDEYLESAVAIQKESSGLPRLEDRYFVDEGLRKIDESLVSKLEECESKARVKGLKHCLLNGLDSEKSKQVTALFKDINNQRNSFEDMRNASQLIGFSLDQYDVAKERGFELPKTEVAQQESQSSDVMLSADNSKDSGSMATNYLAEASEQDQKDLEEYVQQNPNQSLVYSSEPTTGESTPKIPYQRKNIPKPAVHSPIPGTENSSNLIGSTNESSPQKNTSNSKDGNSSRPSYEDTNSKAPAPVVVSKTESKTTRETTTKKDNLDELEDRTRRVEDLKKRIADLRKFANGDSSSTSSSTKSKDYSEIEKSLNDQIARATKEADDLRRDTTSKRTRSYSSTPRRSSVPSGYQSPPSLPSFPSYSPSVSKNSYVDESEEGDSQQYSSYIPEEIKNAPKATSVNRSSGNKRGLASIGGSSGSGAGKLGAKSRKQAQLDILTKDFNLDGSLFTDLPEYEIPFIISMSELIELIKEQSEGERGMKTSKDKFAITVSKLGLMGKMFKVVEKKEKTDKDGKIFTAYYLHTFDFIPDEKVINEITKKKVKLSDDEAEKMRTNNLFRGRIIDKIEDNYKSSITEQELFDNFLIFSKRTRRVSVEEITEKQYKELKFRIKPKDSLYKYADLHLNKVYKALYSSEIEEEEKESEENFFVDDN